MDPVPVLAFPFAGAGPSVFRACQSEPSAVLRLCPMLLPGREQRFGEALFTSVDEAADGLVAQALELVGNSPRVALFGHSLGAVLAYEMAHRLARRGAPEVVHLFVSGSPGPWSPREQQATGLSDDRFLARVQAFAGYAHPALEHPELREMLLPVLRADVEMHEGYRARSSAPLPVPITSIRGSADTLVSAAEAAEWSAATTRGCRLVEVPGGHMYLAEAPGEIVRLFEDGLTEPVGAA